MLKQSKSPDGYRYLLVYKKAEELLTETMNFTAAFPHEKTINDLEDQMNRSARSVKANIVEGWKRNATHEYYTFLGYSVASNAELLEDYLDICLGRYKERGVMGAKGEMGTLGGIEKLRFYPVNPILPIVVKLFLKAKELNFLLEKLQQSLLERMQEKQTLSEADRMRLVREARKKKDDEDEAWLKSQCDERGLVMTAHGLKKREHI